MPEPIPATVVPAFEKQDIEKNKYIASLSYIGILVFVPLFLKRDSKFAQEHAKQGLILFIIGLLGSLVFRMSFIGGLIGLAVFIVCVLGFFKCLSGEFWEVPLVGGFRNKINL